MLSRLALVVKNHGDTGFLVIGFPLGKALDVGIARLDEREPDAADELFELVGSGRGTCHLTLQADIVEHKGQFHTVRGTEGVALWFPCKQIEVGWRTTLCGLGSSLTHGSSAEAGINVGHLFGFCLRIGFLKGCGVELHILIDLYAEYKEVPIVYGLLDATADTNYIKITRAFFVEDDAYQVALNPDSSNYAGKLDVRLVEYCNGDSVREIILDTITLHGKQQGTFYSPNQKLYYTPAQWNHQYQSLHGEFRLLWYAKSCREFLSAVFRDSAQILVLSCRQCDLLRRQHVVHFLGAAHARR